MKRRPTLQCDTSHIPTVVTRVSMLPKFMWSIMVFSPGFIFSYLSTVAKRLAGKSVSDITYIVSSAWDVFKPQLNQSIGL